jgi:hypothetical protein
LIKNKNIFTSKNEKEKKPYFFQSINHQKFALSNANNNSSNILKTINEKSKNAKISIVKNAQNFLNEKKVVATVKRILKRKIFFKSSSRNIEKISKTFRLENVANNENLVSKN